MDWWMDGQKDGWMNGPMDRWMDEEGRWIFFIYSANAKTAKLSFPMTFLFQNKFCGSPFFLIFWNQMLQGWKSLDKCPMTSLTSKHNCTTLVPHSCALSQEQYVFCKKCSQFFPITEKYWQKTVRETTGQKMFEQYHSLKCDVEKVLRICII